MLGNHPSQVPLCHPPPPTHTHTPKTIFIVWGLNLEKLPSGRKGQKLLSLRNPNP